MTKKYLVSYREFIGLTTTGVDVIYADSPEQAKKIFMEEHDPNVYVILSVEEQE